MIDKDITLDNWRPSIKENKPVLSEWRKKQIGENFDQQPALDELKKINSKIEKGMSDSDIMKFFGITCDTLLAIKNDRYSPINGISLDNLGKIWSEFEKIERKINRMMNGLNYMAEIMFVNKSEFDEYKKECRKLSQKSKVKKLNEYEHLDSIYEDEYSYSESDELDFY